MTTVTFVRGIVANPKTGWRWWIEFSDHALEGLLEFQVVLLGMLTNEVADLAITVGGLFVLDVLQRATCDEQ